MILRSLRVGFFLMVRYLRRGSRWATPLIVTIMFLTFLNVVVVRGVLVGLPVGASISYEHEYSGQVIATPLSNQRHIDRTRYLEQVLPTLEGYRAHSARYLASGVLRADYKRPQKASLVPDQVGTAIVGIDPLQEDAVTRLSTLVIEGRYLREDDTNAILLGSQLLDRYAGNTPESGGTPDTTGSLSGIYPGDTVRLAMGEVVGEYEVVGIIEGKVGENSRRVFMVDRHLHNVLGRSTDKKDEVAIALNTGASSALFVQALHESGTEEYATIQTARESQGQFLDDIADTFDLLGNGVGFIGVIVAAITVFVMIFIVALNRQKQIGILKGIGINRLAIESSYVFLSIAYACVGIGLGVLVLYGVIAPYVAVHPIDFPFADGVLVAPWNDTLARGLILIATTLIAGYLPARLIVQKRTIDAILGR
ncbi:MAG: ABC transporter permease [Candidatus Pacebacteria bacterium]|nr:ABC transporter permease [Candidatus Paceibacterota bacterium]